MHNQSHILSMLLSSEDEDFSMANPDNLLSMMQSGGHATRGSAMLAQAMQRQSDMKKLESQQRQEAERQRKGRFWGSTLGKLGGIAGAAFFGPVAGAAIGEGLGTAIGDRLGAGKAKDYDSSGTVFAQQDFRDVDEASKDYSKGMWERAGTAGLEAGFDALTAPGGGLYGDMHKKAGNLRATMAHRLGLTSSSIPSVVPDEIIDAGIADSFLDDASMFDRLPLPSSYDPRSQVSLDMGMFDQLQNGGLIGMQNGGFAEDDRFFRDSAPLVTGPEETQGQSMTESILRERGINPTPQQLALFEDFDPTELQQITEGLQQGLLAGTMGAQADTATTKFSASGASEEEKALQREAAVKQMGSARTGALKDFKSQILGTSADFINQGAEFAIDSSVPKQPPTGVPSSTFGPSWTQQGPDGRQWVWTGTQWITGD